MKTFEPNKTITELGIDTTRKFIVIKEWNFNAWDILTLEGDDDTSSPFFKNQNGGRTWTHLSNLAYYEEEKKEELPLPRWVYVSDTSAEDALKMNHKRLLVLELPENFYRKYFCVDDWGTLEKWTGITKWKYIVEIPPEDLKEKMTLEQIEEALGKKIEIIN